MTQSLKSRYGFENPFKVDPLVRKAFRYCERGKVLDVGCGEGADSVYFARRGYQVTAFDKDETYLARFRAYRKDHNLSRITVRWCDALHYGYPPNTYDIINCILVICCMRRSEFERLVDPLKRSVKPGGLVIMSARNYLDPELGDYLSRGKMIESNTFRKDGDCCRSVYFIEENRLREAFEDFTILYYREGFAPCKYHEHPRHGDSTIICRRKKR